MVFEVAVRLQAFLITFGFLFAIIRTSDFVLFVIPTAASLPPTCRQIDSVSF